MRVYTIDEAAAELGVSAHALRKRAQAGTFEAQKIGGRRGIWVVTEDEIDKWRGVGKLRRGPAPKAKGDDAD